MNFPQTHQANSQSLAHGVFKKYVEQNRDIEGIGLRINALEMAMAGEGDTSLNGLREVYEIERIRREAIEKELTTSIAINAIPELLEAIGMTDHQIADVIDNIPKRPWSDDAQAVDIMQGMSQPKPYP